MDYTKQECIKWSKNRMVDPRYNSKIEIGSDAYNMLSDLCKIYDIVISYRIKDKTSPLFSQTNQPHFTNPHTNTPPYHYIIANGMIVKHSKESPKKYNKNKGVIHRL